MSLPSISVIVLTYNDRLEIEECLSSLGKQTSENIEIIVVASNPSSRLLAVLERYKIRVITNDKKLGVSEARNTGIKAAKGKTVAFIDDDAVADKDWVRNIIGLFENDEVIAARGLVEQKNKSIYNRVAVHYNLNGSEKYVGTLLGCNMIVRRSVFEKIGLFDEKLDYVHDELDLSLRLLKAGKRIIYSPRIVVSHNYCRSFGGLLKKSIRFGEKEVYLIKKHRFDFMTLRYAVGTILSLGILCSPLVLLFPIIGVPSGLSFAFLLTLGVQRCRSLAAGFLFALTNVLRTASLVGFMYKIIRT